MQIFFGRLDFMRDHPMTKRSKHGALVVSVLLLCSMLIGLLAVYTHVKQLGLEYLDEGNQVRRHNAVLAGTACSPWQYRVLPDYVVESIIVVFKRLDVPHPYASAFIAFRSLVSVTLFALAAFYYKKLGMNTYLVILGLTLLGWGMTHSTYDSDLQFNNFLDVVFYLGAALVIMYRKHWWVLPITAVAALNRETSGLIPFMLLAVHFRSRTKYWVPRKILLIASASLFVYAAVFVALRLAFGEQPLITAYGHRPGIELLRYNVGRYITWMYLFAAMGVLPIMAVLSIRWWPEVLRRFFWAIVPVYCLTHLFLAVMAEARVLLVPQTLVFVPGALFGICRFPLKSSDSAPDSSASSQSEQNQTAAGKLHG